MAGTLGGAVPLEDAAGDRQAAMKTTPSGTTPGAVMVDATPKSRRWTGGGYAEAVPNGRVVVDLVKAILL
ncbi:MAG: hypothetical protein V2B19_15620 [Pseudomonadota bacterium]